MTKKVLVVTSLTAIFVASMIMVPAFAGGHLTFDEVEVEGRSLEIEVTADIPQDGSAGAFGYGAFGTKAILAIATHGGVGPDSESQTGAADPVLHTHAVTAKTVTPCPSGLAIASASFEEVGDLEVDGNEIEVENISKKKIGKLTGTIVSFTLTLEGGDICINVIDSATAD